ncbi:MAG TPA: hypothetical protein VMI11_14475 [Actinomycetes bacterium]|nr:hypothetical protein [Actinomycetes bacterium]
MPRVRDLLYRFRPAGAPGAASAAGVPVDRRADMASELAPLFGLLTDTEGECVRIRERADADAAETRREAATEAGDILATARRAADGERAAAASRVGVRAAAETQAEARGAEARAAAVRAAGEGRLDAVVDAVMERVRDLLGEGAAPTTGAR